MKLKTWKLPQVSYKNPPIDRLHSLKSKRRLVTSILKKKIESARKVKTLNPENISRFPKNSTVFSYKNQSKIPEK